MGHDEFCLVCAVAHGHGPHSLRHDSYFTDYEFAEEMLAENSELKKGADEIVGIIKELFDKLSIEENSSQWLPEGVRNPNGFRRSVAIGHWDAQGDGVSQEVDSKLVFPTGRNVDVRVVDDIFAGKFNQVITIRLDGEEIVEEKTTNCQADEDTPCFFVNECCYHYLRGWLDMKSLPPPVHGTNPPLTFEEEFYEIVNSRQELRESYKGVLPCIEYGGAEGYLDQYQEFFAPMRASTRNLAQAISQGLRGDNLIPAILLDFRVWMFMSPDIWPNPPEVPYQPIDVTKYFDLKHSKSLFDDCPNEIMQLIACQLPVEAFLSLSSACRQLRCRLLVPQFVSHIFKAFVLTGSLNWILPVETFRGEVERANSAARQWLDPTIAKDSTSPLQDPAFPYFDFVRACFGSYSMMNRRRIWKMVHQFEALWRDYRTNGWEVDRFSLKR